MIRFWNKKRCTVGNQCGFTLIELMIVVAIIGILAAITVPLYANAGTGAGGEGAGRHSRHGVGGECVWAHTGTLPSTFAVHSPPWLGALGC